MNEALAALNDLVHERPTTPTREAARAWLKGQTAAEGGVRAAYASSGHRFAVRNLMAQRIWDDFSAKLRSAGARG